MTDTREIPMVQAQIDSVPGHLTPGTYGITVK